MVCRRLFCVEANKLNRVAASFSVPMSWRMMAWASWFRIWKLPLRSPAIAGPSRATGRSGVTLLPRASTAFKALYTVASRSSRVTTGVPRRLAAACARRALSSSCAPVVVIESSYMLCLFFLRHHVVTHQRNQNIAQAGRRVRILISWAGRARELHVIRLIDPGANQIPCNCARQRDVPIGVGRPHSLVRRRIRSVGREQEERRVRRTSRNHELPLVPNVKNRCRYPGFVDEIHLTANCIHLHCDEWLEGPGIVRRRRRRR